MNTKFEIKIIVEERGLSEWVLLRNDKPILTPKGSILSLPTSALAIGIKEEWEKQDPKKINPALMPLQQMAATAIDMVAPNIDGYCKELLKYGGTDLLCYHADAHSTLAERQATSWLPLLHWLKETHHVYLRTTSSILSIEQPDLPLLLALLKTFNSWQLAGLGVAVPNLGSLVLGLAFFSGRLSLEDAHALAHLEEIYQEEKWGSDEEALRRRENLKAELVSVRSFFDLLQ